MPLSLNARRRTCGFAWLRQAKAAYRDRQYSGLIIYGIAGSLMTPDIVLRKLLERKMAEPLRDYSFKLGLNTEGQPYSSLRPNPIHEHGVEDFAQAGSNPIVQKGGHEMAKQNEIDYIKTVAKIDNVDENAFKTYLRRKPFGDNEVGDYLMDMGQFLKFLPPRPARILDLGVGSGWTSEIFAKCDYEVVGLDISHDMIELAKQKLSPELKLEFEVLDYEQEMPFGRFDAVVMYDSLHHAVNERVVIQRVAAVLNPGGRFLCLEPGKGHSSTQLSVDVMQKYGTTEKDMPFSHVRTLLKEVGFSKIQQYVRLRQLPFVDVAPSDGSYQQMQQFISLMYETTENGLTSLVVAFK